MALTAAAAMGAFAQNPGSVPNSLPTPGSVATVSVHGNVLNAANGQPVRRALVKTDGTPERGAVTDESGRFEIRGVPEGVVEFRIAKPGFQNSADADFFDSSQPHRVRVGSGMPDLSFSIAPFGSISGHVTLSDDLPAQGIGLILMRKTMSGGREEWEVGERHQATPDGAFRFSGVRAGTYLLLTEPAFENGDAAEPSCNAAAPAEIPGFAAQFYSDAQDIQGAEPIDVAPGQAAEVNLALRLTPLHLVQIAVSGVPAGDDEHFSPILLDRGGQMLGYPVHVEEDHTLCAYLPDGSYTVSVSSTVEGAADKTAGRQESVVKQSMAVLNFNVDGRAERGLKASLTRGSATPVLIRYEPAPPPPLKQDETVAGRYSRNQVLTLLGKPVQAATNQWNRLAQAFPTGENTYRMRVNLPGAYEISASSNREGVCLGAVTSGGQDLAQTLWTAGPEGGGDPIEVVLRTDCANLTLNMPADLPEAALGEGAVLFVYVVPAFHWAGFAPTARLVQFGERTASLKGLTPGAYRVFTFRNPRDLAFRDANALDQLGPGQELVLEPHGNATLTVEEGRR